MSPLWKASQQPQPLGLFGNQQGRFGTAASLPIMGASLTRSSSKQSQASWGLLLSLLVPSFVPVH